MGKWSGVEENGVVERAEKQGCGGEKDIPNFNPQTLKTPTPGMATWYGNRDGNRVWQNRKVK